MFNTQHKSETDPQISALHKLVRLLADPASLSQEMKELDSRYTAIVEAETSLNEKKLLVKTLKEADDLKVKALSEYKKVMEDVDSARKLGDEILKEAKETAKLTVDNSQVVIDQMKSEADRTLRDANEKHDSITQVLESMADEHDKKMTALSDWENGLKKKDAELSHWEDNLTEKQAEIDEKVSLMKKLGVSV